MSIPYGGIDHIGIVVRDINAAKATYRDVLGFNVTGGDILEDRGLEVVFVDTGNSRIELIAPTRADSEVSSFLDKRGEGIHHMCVRVPNIDEALATLKTQGARLLHETAKAGAHNTRVAFVHPKATHGVLLELVEAHNHP